MKTLELELKKEVLILDENDFDYYELFKDGIYLKLKNGDRDYIEGNFEFICKGSELTEEIASEFIQSFGRGNLKRFKGYFKKQFENTAIESFISAVESKKFYWLENPIEKPSKLNYLGEQMVAKYQYERDLKKWEEAEEKTFRNPLIFVKK